MADTRMPAVIGVAAAAAYLDIDRTTLWRLSKSGEGPPTVLILRQRKYLVAALDEWLRSRMETAA